MQRAKIRAQGMAAAAAVVLGGGAAHAEEGSPEAQGAGERTVLPQVRVIPDPGGLPASGQVVSRDEIRQHGYDDINRALRNAPGVYVREEDGYGMFPNISLRGVDHGRSAKVTIMEDGVMQAPAPYAAPAAYYSPVTARMEGIEVLKGSSQIRYGPHTTGGAINYQSTPIPWDREGYVRVGAGTDDEVRVHAHHGETFETQHGNVGYLLEAFERRNTGFRHISDSYADEGIELYDSESEDTGLRTSDYIAKLMWEPETARYQRWELMAGSTERNANESYQGLYDDDFDDDPFQRYSSTRLDAVYTEQDRFSLSHLWDLSEGVEIHSMAYYTEFNRSWDRVRGYALDDDGDIATSLDDDMDGDGVRHAEGLWDDDGREVLQGQREGVLNFRFNNRDYYTLGVQTELDGELALGEWTHDWAVGVRYHEDEIERDQRQDAIEQDERGFFVDQSVGEFGEANPNTGIHPGDRVQQAQAYSAWAENAMNRGRWTVTPGVRAEYIDAEFEDDEAGDSGDDSLTVFAGSLAASFQHTPQTLYYGGVHQGYSVPDPMGIADDGVDEETSLSLELGQRYTSRDQAFQSDIGLFYTQLSDLIAAPVAGAGGTEDGETANVGDVNTAGVELELVYDVGAAQRADYSLPLSLVATYTDATFDGDVAEDDPGSIFGGALDGNDVPYVPDLQLKAGAGFHTGPYSISMDLVWQDEMYGTGANVDAPQEVTLPGGDTIGPDARQGKIDSFWYADLTGEYDFTEQATAFVNIHNLTDEAYMTTRLPHGPRPGKGRTVMMGFETTF